MNPSIRWADWIGRTRESEDLIGPERARAMQATLDLEEAPLSPGDPLPPLWHWLYFWELEPRHLLGPDGHPRRGDFLPPIELPRRMWAGSRLSFPATLSVGAAALRRSSVTAVNEKEGRSGKLVFVTVRHEITAGGLICIEEEHDIVYREAPQGSEAEPRASEPAPDKPSWHWPIEPDPVLLFRYSALTFNGHRIHYDLRYATETEGYDGLIVHGPLLATLMLELARREAPEKSIHSFRFRALRPVFDTAPFTVGGEPDGRLFVADAQGRLAMQGEAVFRD